jgi:hypothetical protein
MTRLVYDEEVELFLYIYRHCGAQYFSELQRRVIRYHHRRFTYEGHLRWLQGLNVEISDSTDCGLKHLDPGAMDPSMARELQNGFEDFMRRTGQSALHDHGDAMAIPRCAKCNALLRAPKARQCVWCGHSWFDAA